VLAEKYSPEAIVVHHSLTDLDRGLAAIRMQQQVHLLATLWPKAAASQAEPMAEL
jgi:hypothetical protein